MTSQSMSIPPREFHYDAGRKGGVTTIALAGMTSLIAVLYLIMVKRLDPKTFRGTHIFGYLMCLLAANVLQSTGAVIDLEWVARGGVVENSSCSFQGGIKQAGNLGISSWSLVLSIHVYLLVFFRIRSNKVTFIGTISCIWSIILVLILVGRFALQKSELGPYFGISEATCWITSEYLDEQIFFECFFTMFGLVFSFLLYTVVLLRVRGNLVKGSNRQWSFRSVDKQDRWKISAISRDIGVATSTLRIAKTMLWYTVYYSIMLLPATMIRIYEFGGHTAPFALTAVSAVVYNLMGLVNVIFVLYIVRRFPQAAVLPLFPTRLQYIKNTTQSILKTTEITITPSSPFEESDPGKLHTGDLPRIVTVDLPTQPSSTYVAPVSWKTSSPGGRMY